MMRRTETAERQPENTPQYERLLADSCPIVVPWIRLNTSQRRLVVQNIVLRQLICLSTISRIGNGVAGPSQGRFSESRVHNDIASKDKEFYPS
jgi:hypothetical protein